MTAKKEEACEACGGCGWLLAENDTHGDRVERCDNCQRFATDSKAILHTYECDVCRDTAVEAWRRKLAANLREEQRGQFSGHVIDWLELLIVDGTQYFREGLLRPNDALVRRRLVEADSNTLEGIAMQWSLLSSVTRIEAFYVALAEMGLLDE
jgi:hypothetical protein